MKNQYVGDIGDYGKYGMLRYLASKGMKIGINWYLCPDDGRTDGNHTEYLSDERMRVYDAAAYDALKKIAFREDKTVQLVENSGILDGMSFYNRMLDLDSVHWSQRAEKRNAWHQEALNALLDANLVFADPDNSLSVTKKPTQKGAEKFILPDEIMDYYNRGQDVVYYHHRSRKNEKCWMEEKTQIQRFLPDARLMAVSFHRWSCRVYIFVVHENKAELYNNAIKDFMSSSWGMHKVDGKVPFTYEEIYVHCLMKYDSTIQY